MATKVIATLQNIFQTISDFKQKQNYNYHINIIISLIIINNYKALKISPIYMILIISLYFVQSPIIVDDE